MPKLRILTMCTLALACQPVPTVTANVFSVRAYASASGGAGSPSLTYLSEEDTGSLQQSSTGVAVGGSKTSPSKLDMASSSFSGAATLGGLSAGAKALAQGNAFRASSTAGGTVTWMDTVTIAQELAAGTPVDFKASLRLSSFTQLGGVPNLNGTANIDATIEMGFVPILSTAEHRNNLAHDVKGLDTTVLHLHAGDVIVFEGILSAYANTGAEFPIQTAGSADADGGHTAVFNLDPVTAGARYTTASGVSYLSNVPEPSALSLLGTALVVLAIRFAVRQGRPAKHLQQRFDGTRANNCSQ
jgi:hypothetical protein